MRREVAGAGFGHHGGAGPAAEGVGHEVVAVAGVAPDGEEQVAGLERAGVNRGATDRALGADQAPARRGLEFLPRPECGHGQPPVTLRSPR
jgi:hypothetical protein